MQVPAPLVIPATCIAYPYRQLCCNLTTVHTCSHPCTHGRDACRGADMWEKQSRSCHWSWVHDTQALPCSSRWSPWCWLGCCLGTSPTGLVSAADPQPPSTGRTPSRTWVAVGNPHPAGKEVRTALSTRLVSLLCKKQAVFVVRQFWPTLDEITKAFQDSPGEERWIRILCH